MSSVRLFLPCVTILTILSSSYYHANAQQEVPVQTSLGTLVGIVNTTNVTGINVTYYSYYGIQYATATRFKAPKAVTQAWTVAKPAKTEGPICPQPVLTGSPDTGATQDENCLYLNIYSPQLANATTKLPVLVFIHGGAFIVGSSRASLYGPQLFMSQGGVILVTFNYRVGIFGFLSTGTKDAQGNAGLKDQVEALKYVKREISNFGGDPNKITIFGESAGAASVIHHLLSPMSKGLFNGSIAESGSALSDWGYIESSVALDRATKIARNLQCNTENATTVVSCLSEMSVSALVGATNQLLTPPSATNLMSEEEIMESTVLFSPVIETKFDEEVFLADSIENVLNSVQTTVPLIIGTNKDEGMLFLTEDTAVYDFVDRNLKYAVPRQVKKTITSDTLNAYGAILKKYYFNDTKVSTSTLPGYVNLYTDHLFMYPTVQTVRKLIKKKTGDVYLYHFAYSGDYKVNSQAATNLKYQGVSHGEELLYLFYVDKLKQDLNKTSDDNTVATTMIKLWKTFAATGAPTASGDAFQWTKLNNVTDLKYLDMSSKTFKETADYYKARIAIWDQFVSSGLQTKPTILITLISFLLIFKLF